MAKEASLGIFGLCLIISRDKSLIDSMAAQIHYLLLKGPLHQHF